MKHTSRTWAPGLVCAALLLSGCGGDGEASADDAPASTSPSSQAPSPTPSDTAQTPVDGTWTLEQTKADVVEHLEESGFGRLTDRFLRVEGVWAQDNWEWEFQDGDFTARWMQPDRVWKVADWGTYEVEGDRLKVRYGDSGTVTTYRWSLKGDELTLDWLAYSSDVQFKGIPDEAYWRAFLTKPLERAA